MHTASYIVHLLAISYPSSPSQFHHVLVYKEQRTTTDKYSLFLTEPDGNMRGMMNGRMFVNSLLIYYLVQCGFNSLTNMADVKPVLWTILDSGLMERRIGLNYWTRVNSFILSKLSKTPCIPVPDLTFIKKFKYILRVTDH